MSQNFSSARWDGPENIDDDGRVESGGTDNAPPLDARRMAHDMMSAAYAALITEDESVAEDIVDEIRWHSERSALDYWDRTLWPVDGDHGGTHFDDMNPLFMQALWARDLLIAYDVASELVGTNEDVEDWFAGLADLNQQVVDINLENVFPERLNEDWSDRSSWVDDEPDYSSCWLQEDGTAISQPRIPRFYNNRRNNQIGFVGLVGVLLEDDDLIHSYKIYAREWVMFGHRTEDGVFGDVDRGTDGFPQLGLSYAFHGNEGILMAAEALARTGDTTIYDFSSSDGSGGSGGTAEDDKSFEDIIELYIRRVDQDYPATYDRSGCPPDSSVAGDADNRIVSRHMPGGRELINDGTFLYPSNYFDRPEWKDVVLRDDRPTGFTSSVQRVGTIGGWRTDWRTRFLVSFDTDPYGGSCNP